MVSNARRKFKAKSSETRATIPDEKAIRRQALLDAGLALFGKRFGALPSVIEITKKAGLSKAAFYIYFETKEELFLALHAQMVQAWLFKVAQAIDGLEPESKVDVVVDALATELRADTRFMNLSLLTKGVLEKNVSVDAMVSHQVSFAKSLEPLINAVLKLRPNLAVEKLRTVILQTYAMILGLWQMHSAGAMYDKAASVNPAIAYFKVDMEADLRDALKLIWLQLFD